MLKEDIKPDVVTYNVLISGFFQRGLVTTVDDPGPHDGSRVGEFTDVWSVWGV